MWEGFECWLIEEPANCMTGSFQVDILHLTPGLTWFSWPFDNVWKIALLQRKKTKNKNKTNKPTRREIQWPSLPLDPFISSFVDSIRKKLHECFVFILELNFRIWWNYLCVILVHTSEAFQVTDGSNLTILINSKNIHIDHFPVFPIFLTSWKISSHYNGRPRWSWEVPELMELSYPEGCWEVCTFIFIHFIFFTFFRPSVQSCLVKYNLCAYK